MPIRKFICTRCKIEWCKLVSPQTKTSLCIKCGQKTEYIYGSQTSTMITERLNNYWNKSLPVDLRNKMTEHSREHMREHEMHDMIAKFGVETLKNHPLIKNGRIRKKDE